MGLVEDAKALVCPRNCAENCFYCNADVYDDPHEPACPWLAMPRIVRALEAAQALADADSMAEEALARRALVAAMQGD